MSKIQSETFYLAGGVDTLSPHIGISPGRLIGCLNVWQEGGIIGYWRAKGYERFDGHPDPSSETEPVDQETARALINEVPGGGDVLGVCRYGGNQYAWRNDTGGATAKMFVSSSSGWSEITPTETIEFTGGTTAFVAQETLSGGSSGETATIERVVLQSGAWDGTAEGYLVISSASGAFTNPETITSASGSATSASTNEAIILQPNGDYDIIVHNFYGATNLRKIYWCNGVDTAYMFNGTVIVPIRVTGMADDKPTHLAAHLSRLWLSYPGGSIQRSAVKDPITFSALLGAGEMATGSDVVSIDVLTKATLAFLCQNDDSIWMLQGTDETTWDFSQFSDSVGAKANTVQGINNLVFMSGDKLTTLQATQKFGDFVDNDLDEGLARFIKDRIPVTAISVLKKSQYRLFFDDGFVACVTFNKGKPTTSTILQYNFQATCTWSTIEDGEEYVYVGADNGFVYQLDSGNTFDGESITGFIRLPYYHFKSQRHNKHFLKVIAELDGPISLTENTTLTLLTEFDYGSSEIPNSREYLYTVVGGGTYWDWLGEWGSFAYDAPVVDRASADLDGIAENMSTYIGFESIYDTQFNLQALTVDFVVLGRKR